VAWGRDPRTFKPQGVKFRNNKVIADKVRSLVIEFSGGAKPEGNDLADNELVGTKARIGSKIAKAFTGMQVQPEAEPEEEEEGPEVPPVVIPQQPETDPVTQPTPESEPYVRLCQLCGREEARKKLVIYVCSPHAEVARPDMQKLLADLKAKVDKEPSIEEEVITTG
jgi:hypothetical protein